MALEYLTNTKIRVRGIYRAPGTTNHSDKPLHFKITAESEEDLALALVAIQHASENGIIMTSEVVSSFTYL